MINTVLAATRRWLPVSPPQARAATSGGRFFDLVWSRAACPTGIERLSGSVS